jgi:hypothetical protein
VPQRRRQPPGRFAAVEQPWCPVAQVTGSAATPQCGSQGQLVADLPAAVTDLDGEQPGPDLPVRAEHGQTGELRARINPDLDA